MFSTIKQYAQYLAIAFFVLISTRAQSAEDSTYSFNWLDPDKEVYVLQNRKFRKVKAFYLHAGFGVTTSGAFDDATVLQGRAGYFFTENWGLEFVYSNNDSEFNEVVDQVNQALSGQPFVRLIKNYYGGMLLWSPFYAKINTFDKIWYFDWIFGAGVASITEENNRDGFNAGVTTRPLGEETHTGFMWGTAWRFYFLKYLSARIDWTGLHYKATKAIKNSTEKVFYKNYDLTFGVTFSF